MLPQEETFVFKYKLQIGLLLLGVLLVSGGIIVYKSPNLFSDQIEKVNQTQELQYKNIVVEIAGAVVTPGVYTLPSNLRVEDLIQKAGGVTEEADKEIISKSINKAALLKDGQKITIPSVNKQTLGVSATNDREGKSENVQILNTDFSSEGLININTASQKELEKLYGIGPVTAQKIIEQRPYSDTLDLLNKGIVKQSIFEKIKSQISVQ